MDQLMCAHNVDRIHSKWNFIGRNFTWIINYGTCGENSWTETDTKHATIETSSIISMLPSSKYRYIWKMMKNGRKM